MIFLSPGSTLRVVKRRDVSVFESVDSYAGGYFLSPSNSFFLSMPTT